MGDGLVFFYIVFCYSYLELVNFLFIYGVDIYVVDKNGWNVLYYLVKDGIVVVVDVFFK